MIEVEIDDSAWLSALPTASALALSAAEAAAGRDPADIAILLTDDQTVRHLNARFRERDQATNVLAFPAPSLPGGPLGDVALAFGVCAAEALDQDKPLADHLRHLVVHGVLHLLGYDHLTDEEAACMEAREQDLLAGLHIPDPYADRVEQGDHVQHLP
jgi:probable rRNA maturation factor